MFDRHSQTRLIHITSILAICVFIHGQAIAANPSNKDIDAGIAIHGRAYAAELANQAQALYEKSNTATIGFVKSAKENRVARLSWKPLGENDVRLVQLRRLGNQLQFLGETAGIDYRLRADALLRTSGDVVAAFRATPAAQKQLAPVRIKLRASDRDRRRVVEKLEKLINEGKWEAAETQMYDYLDKLGVATACLFDREIAPYYQPFNEVRAAIDAAMRQARIAQARQLLTQRRQAEAPDFTGVLRELEAAATSLGSSGTVTIDGMAATGPQAITKFGERWADVQVRTIRCRTLDWLLASAAASNSGSPLGQTTSQVVKDFGTFNSEMMKSLAKLIRADANRVTGPDAMRLYVEYLQACAPLIRRSENQRLAAAIHPALQALASRAPQFPDEIAAYAEGTDDLLRWRQRVARGMAYARAEAFPSIDSLMFSATRSETGYRGLYPITTPNPDLATLLGSAPEAISRPVERLQGKQAHALDVVRLGGNGPVAIARYRLRSYANFPAPLDLAAETDALKFDLMVAEELPALSILAAVAVDSAERGDLAAVGGTITNQYLESFATRFAALPSAASVLTPLGTIPHGDPEYAYENQVLMRFDLTPNWAQHDFFFVEFQPPAGTTE